MLYRLLFLIVVLIVRVAVVAAEPSDAPLATAVGFDPPIQASVRMADQSVLEGKMSRFDVEGVHFTTKAGKKLFIPLKQIRLLTSQSGFQFNADSDKALHVIQQAHTQQDVSTVAPPAEEVGRHDVLDLEESNWSSLVAASRAEQAAANGSGFTVKPGRNRKSEQSGEFLCPKCGHLVKADDTVIAQFEFCPKCGSAQSDNASSVGAEAEAPASGQSPEERTQDSTNVVSGSEATVSFAQTQMGRSLFFVLATAVFYIIFKWLFPDRE